MKAFPWDILLEWYEKNGRTHLPWRDYSIPHSDLVYRIWISEIFLQQTQAERVEIYFKKVIEKYPTLSDLADTTYEEFFPYYQGLGYYSRARNLLKTATIIKNDFSGIFPEETKVLQKLPGIGKYTSEAIRAFWYGIPTLSWDTNLEKVFSRFYFGRRDQGLSETEKYEVWKNLLSYIGSKSLESPEGMKKLTRDINNALMDFSRIIDKNEKSKIDWESYPLRDSIFFQERGDKEVERERKSIQFPIPDAKILIVLHKNHTEYYSKNTSTYTVFELAPSLNREPRSYIQGYFQDQYGLIVSVRPIHKKWLSSEWKPFILVNAQIQVWEHTFHTYKKEDMRNAVETLYAI